MSGDFPSESPFWDRSRHADRRGFLLARAKIITAIRAWFADQGFLEADVGALVPSPGAEVHVEAFETRGRYLHTSPEFAMKKLLAAGEEKIFYLGKVYRSGEIGPLHAPEFTMLEWYRANAPYQQVQDDCIEICRVAAKAAGTLKWRRWEREMDPFLAPIHRTVQDAFEDFASIDLLSTIREDGSTDRDSFIAQIRANSNLTDKVGPPYAGSDDTWSDIFSQVLAGDVERQLGWDGLTILDQYPAVEAALARRSLQNPKVAERFELYAFGVELANGFGELTDPVEQRARLVAAMDEKQKRYGVRWPIDEDFLAALAHMPPASGVALGLDRLVLLCSGARTLADVLWLPPGGGSES